MADVYIVMLHRGSGEIAGAFSTYALAASYVGTRPPCNYTIQKETVDDGVGTTVTGQFGFGMVTGKTKVSGDRNK